MFANKARPLEEVVAAEFSDAAYRADLSSITGSRSDRDIAGLIRSLVVDELGAELRGAFFAEKSVGAVFGLGLSTGERVVLKLFHPAQTLSELAAMQRFVEHLGRAGFPAPAPRSRLFQTEDGMIGSFYALIDGGIRDGHEPLVRRELARCLAELMGLLAVHEPTDLPLAPTRRAELWPPSHRVFLSLSHDVEATAQWIDEIGRRAQFLVRSVPLTLVPAHLDWGVKNVRFQRGRVCAVFDWDSLCAASEAEMVGRAAVGFTAQWDFQARLTPTPDEALAFIQEYEAARGRSFVETELRVLGASAEYLVAQVARLEFAAARPPSDGFLAFLRSIAGATSKGRIPGGWLRADEGSPAGR